jgi:hypothetical protein
VIEWADRLEAGREKMEDGGKLVRVKIEIASEMERKIIYDDSGA